MLNSFKNPGKKFRPVPFWSWNDELTPEEIKFQIEEMEKTGLGGYFMHARSGLKTEYLSEKWHECIKAGMEHGKKNDMNAWIYDEEGWPSGFAGGLVTDMSSDFHARFMKLEEYSDFSEIDIDNMLAVYVLNEAGDGFSKIDLKEASTVNPFKPGKNSKFLAVRLFVQRFYIDVMNKDAVDAFLNFTHQKYYDRFGEEFGKAMKGFFTDEPRFTCNKFGELAWSLTIPDAFLKRYGYSILDKLPLLWRDYDGSKKVRYDFWRLANDLFVKNFMKNIYDWCDEHNCMLTGHIMMEESIFGQMTSTGGVMPFYEYEHIPGIDWLRRRIESPIIAKQVGSVACQLDKKQVITESFALCGWNVSFEELKWILEWQFVNGVNMLCQHLQGYSLKGSRKRDYPPSLFLQQSWWSEYKMFNDYVGRLGAALSEGSEKADVLVIHPMRSGYLSFDGTRTEQIRRLDNEFTKLSKILNAMHISYHFGDETIIEKYGKVSQNKFTVGEISYKTVILPHMYSIGGTTLNFLNEFIKNGGIVLSVGELPAFTDGLTDDLNRLIKAVKKVTHEQILPTLEKSGLVSIGITNQENLPAESISCQQRECEIETDASDMGKSSSLGGGETLLFMVNHSQTEAVDATIHAYGKSYSAEILNALDGSSQKLDCVLKNSNTVFSLKFEPMQSYLVLLKPAKVDYDATAFESKSASQSAVASETVKISLPNSWEIKEMGLNSLTLDLCRYRIDGGELQPKTPVIHLMKTLLDLKRPCGIELVYEFNVNMDLSKNKKFYIALEDAELYEIYVNNQKSTAPSGFWKDKSFKKVDIRKLIHSGKNEVRLIGRFSQNQKVYDVLYGKGVYETELNKLTYDMEMESVYIIGDFGVTSESPFVAVERNAMTTSGLFTITDAPKKFESNNFTTQGLLFFASDLTVKGVINVKKSAERIILDFGKHNAPMIKIFVNGKLVKTSLWAPYNVDITDAASEGENELEIKLFASNRNLLGPHHHINGECYNVGPSSFTGKWSWVERTSEADATDIDDRTKDYWSDDYCFVDFGFKY